GLFNLVSSPQQPKTDFQPVDMPTEAFAVRSIEIGELPSNGRNEAMSDNNISILDGSTFLVASPNGDIDAGPNQPEGLFYKDMRHLSKWKLNVEGITLDVLSTDASEYYYAQHFCVPPTGTIYKNPTLSIVRRRMVGDGFIEHLSVLNHGSEPEKIE